VTTRTGRAAIDNQHHFDRGAWLILAIAVAMLLLSLGSVIYRFTLPTDGWYVTEPVGLDSVGFIYTENLIGAPSGLEPGDHLIAVNGSSLARDLPQSVVDSWRAGQTMRYTVVRAGQELTLDVPLVQRRLGLWLTILLRHPDVLAVVVGLLMFVTIALFACVRRPATPAAPALLTISVLWLTATSYLTFLPFGLPELIDPLAKAIFRTVVTALYTILLPPALLRFALVFPRPKEIVRRRPWIAYLPYAVGLVVLPGFILNGLVGWIWIVVAIITTIAILVHNTFTMRDTISQAQMRWALGGMLLGMGMYLARYPVQFGWVTGSLAALIEIASNFSFGVMGVTLGIAILRYRLFDIDVIIRRTLVYSLLTLTLGMVYIGCIVVSRTLVAPLTGGSELVIVASTLAIAALFSPLRRRIQNVIDKRFYRRKYDAAKVLAAFGMTARDETDLDALTTEMLRVVDETVQPEFVGLWLREPESTPERTNDGTRLR
jgi:hypothetical protein